MVFGSVVQMRPKNYDWQKRVYQNNESSSNYFYKPDCGLRQALHLIETSKTFQLFLDQGLRSQVVSQALIHAGEKSPFLEQVLENLPEKQISISERFSIQVQCFGSFRVLVNGEKVS